MIRRFYLERKEDPTGMSGVGRVAEGVEFENGMVAWSWLSPNATVTISNSITQVEKLHSHNGKDPTKIVWVDDLHENIEEKAKDLKEKKRADEEVEKLEEKEETPTEADTEETKE
jgi:hypothetical protein